MPVLQPRRVITPWPRPGVDRNRSRVFRVFLLKRPSRKGLVTERKARDGAIAQDKLANKPATCLPRAHASREQFLPCLKTRGLLAQNKMKPSWRACAFIALALAAGITIGATFEKSAHTEENTIATTKGATAPFTLWKIFHKVNYEAPISASTPHRHSLTAVKGADHPYRSTNSYNTRKPINQPVEPADGVEEGRIRTHKRRASQSLPWIKAHFPMSYRTARVFTQISKKLGNKMAESAILSGWNMDDLLELASALPFKCRIFGT